MTRKPTALDYADMMNEQYGADSLQVALETVRQVHIRLSRKTAGLREVKPEDDNEQRQIIEAVCQHSGLSQKQLMTGRSWRVCRARFVCWALLRDRLKLSTLEIGRVFEKDHTSVLRGLDQASSRGDDYTAVARGLESYVDVRANVRLIDGHELELEAVG